MGDQYREIRGNYGRTKSQMDENKIVSIPEVNLN